MFSAHGPFFPWPSVKDTFWPSRRSSKLTPWTVDEWKNRSLPFPVSMKPKPLSVNRLIVPSAIHSFPVVIVYIAIRLTIADWPLSIAKSVPSEGASTQVGCHTRRAQWVELGFGDADGGVEVIVGHRHVLDRGVAEARAGLDGHLISADSLAGVYHSAEMIGPVLLHHLSGDPLSLVTNVEFMHTERESVIWAIIDPEDLEPGTTFIGVGEDDGRHGRRPIPLGGDSIICTASTGSKFTSVR